MTASLLFRVELGLGIGRAEGKEILLGGGPEGWTDWRPVVRNATDFNPNPPSDVQGGRRQL